MRTLLRHLFGGARRSGGNHGYGRTDTGRVRPNNEDSFSVLSDRGIFLVSDGMGGHNAGEKASKLSIETMVSHCTLEAVRKISGNCEEIRHFLIRAFHDANNEVMRQAAADQETKGMGATLVAICIDHGLLHTCHVGDSRCYLADAGGIIQITEDHAQCISLVSNGDSPTSRKDSLNCRQVITRAIGFPFPEDPECHEVPLHHGDRILLCSDGLWSMVDDSTLHRILMAAPSPEEAADLLITAANDAGGRDNVTAVVVFI